MTLTEPIDGVDHALENIEESIDHPILDTTLVMPEANGAGREKLTVNHCMTS